MLTCIRMRPLYLLTLLFACSAITAQAAPPAMNPPAESSIPPGPVGDAIRLGKTLITDARRQLPKNGGNGLNCSACHLGGGTVAFAGPYVGLWGVFPEYRQRSNSINSLHSSPRRVRRCPLVRASCGRRSPPRCRRSSRR